MRKPFNFNLKKNALTLMPETAFTNRLVHQSKHVFYAHWKRFIYNLKLNLRATYLRHYQLMKAY